MRLPPGRKRKPNQGDRLSLTLISLLANVLLIGTLLSMYFTSGYRAVEFMSISQAEALVRDTRSEVQDNTVANVVQNVTHSLEAALRTLEEKDTKIAEAESACKLRSQAAAEQSAALQSEAENLRKQLPQISSGGKAWLTIGIPTVPRHNSTDYLTRTLGSLFEELPLDPTDLLYKRVRVIVMNNRPGAHAVWRQVKERIFDGQEDSEDVFATKGRLYADFVDNPGNVEDPAPDAEEPDDNHNPKNRPGREVRRQTCDLVSLLEMAEPLSEYYTLMEDDFRVCPYMLRILGYAVRKLNTIPEYGDWLGLRFSYGMNGILVHNKDLLSLTGYLRKHTARLPPDLLWTEWYMGRRLELRQVTRGRKLAVFRYNLLDHLGAQSSFSIRATRPGWPRCYHPMSDIWSLAASEQFKEKRCSNSDLSPCPKSDGGEIWTKYPIMWPNVTEGVENDHPPLLPNETLLPFLASPSSEQGALATKNMQHVFGAAETL